MTTNHLTKISFHTDKNITLFQRVFIVVVNVGFVFELINGFYGIIERLRTLNADSRRVAFQRRMAFLTLVYPFQ